MSAEHLHAFVEQKLTAIAGHVTEVEQLDCYDTKWQQKCETLLMKLKMDVDVFQESPHLLDGLLPNLMGRLACTALKQDDPTEERMHLSFAAMYLITKTRGYKVAIRQLPHDVQHMMPVMRLLAQQKPDDGCNWQTKYMLLLWLSILCLIPMDLGRFDSGSEDKPLAVM